MKYTLITLLLLSLALTGCIVEPYGGHGPHGGDQGQGNHDPHGDRGR